MTPALHQRLKAAITSRLPADRRAYFALADQVLMSFSNFAIAIIIARWLGKEEFGRYAIAWTIAVVVENIQIALLTTPMLTFAAQRPAPEQPRFAGVLLAHGLALAAATAVIVLLGALAANHLVPDWRLHQIALPLAALILLGQLAELARRYFYAFGPSWMAFRVSMVRVSVLIAGLIAATQLARPDTGLAVTLWIMAAAGATAILVAVPRLSVQWPSREDLARDTIGHWVYGRWLLLANVVNAGREAFVATVIGASLGLAEIGVFRATQQMVNLINIPAFAMHNVVTTPMGAAFAAHGISGALAYARGFVPRYLALLIATLAALSICGSWLLPMVYGAQFAGYGGVVAILALSTALLIVRDVISVILRACNRTDIPLAASIGAALITFTIGYALISRYGLAGAVAGECLYGAVALALVAWGLRRALDPRLMPPTRNRQ